MPWREWLGVGERRWKKAPDEEVQPAKTLWDWLQLLIVPAILVGVTFAWSATQTRSDNKREDRRSQDATLQSYLNQMSALMLHEKLLSSKPGDAVRAVARTVTLTTLRRVDRQRTVEVVRFLAEAGLLSNEMNAGPAVNIEMFNLGGPDFRGVDLGHLSLGALGLEHANFEDAHLAYANLRDADLAGANLRYADLDYANLRSANLKGANLRDAAVEYANIGDANLENANLRNADLSNAHLERVDLRLADLQDAALGNANLQDANLAGANLEDATLRGINFRLANLEGANLRGTNLQNADFKYANLTGADLTGANFDNTKLGAATLRYVKRLDLGAYLSGDLSPTERKVYLDTHKAFLDSLSRQELSRLNLTPEKLATFRRQAGGS